MMDWGMQIECLKNVLKDKIHINNCKGIVFSLNFEWLAGMCG